jgi:hypothetical protein
LLKTLSEGDVDHMARLFLPRIAIKNPRACRHLNEFNGASVQKDNPDSDPPSSGLSRTRGPYPH